MQFQIMFQFFAKNKLLRLQKGALLQRMCWGLASLISLHWGETFSKNSVPASSLEQRIAERTLLQRKSWTLLIWFHSEGKS